MPYTRSRLGQDDFEVWPSELYEGTLDYPTEQPSIWTPSVPSRPSDTWGGDFWSGLKGILVPVSAAAANIIRATTGKPVPPGSMYNPQTGQYVMPTQMNWLIPVLIAGGAILLLSRRRR